MKKTKMKSFTLIELVMVIVIIGILGVIAVPRFINFRQDAQNAAAEGNIAAIRSAISIYYSNTAIPNNYCLCVPNGQTYNSIVGCNTYRTNPHVDPDTGATVPCYPANINEIENNLLVSPPVWYGGGGYCYDPSDPYNYGPGYCN